MAKTWTEKLQSAKKPVVKRLEFPFAGIPAGSNMLISSPTDIENYIKQIPSGRTVTTETLRKDLAIGLQADYTCPVTTGIFLRIVAEAAYETYCNTKSLKNIAPFWRVIDPDSPLAKKLTCGRDFIVRQRRLENTK